MEPSPAQHESPASGAGNERVESGSLSRFRQLAARLFAVDRDDFKRALEKDERERRTRRGG
jgi:hypothetical protein